MNFWRDELRRRGVQRFAKRLSPKMNALLVRALEIEGQPHEVDLSSPDPLVSKILIESYLLSPPLTVQIPAQGNTLGVDGHWWSPVNVHNLKNVGYDVASSLAFAEGRVISQSGLGHRWSRDAAFITGALRRVKDGTPIQLTEPIAPLGQTTNYYHFLIESLPRILRICEISPSVTFITDRQVPDLATDILQFAGVNNQILTTTGVIQSENLWFCEPSPLFFPHPADLHLVSKELGARINEHESNRKPVSEFVYISRSKSTRSIQNEIDLEHYLSSKGFDILYLEAMSLNEQICSIQNAKVVVAPHGAGLSNLVFMGKGTKVIEISGGEWWWPCFRRMAYSLDMDYELLLLPSTPTAPHGTASEAIRLIDEALS